MKKQPTTQENLKHVEIESDEIKSVSSIETVARPVPDNRSIAKMKRCVSEKITSPKTTNSVIHKITCNRTKLRRSKRIMILKNKRK